MEKNIKNYKIEHKQEGKEIWEIKFPGVDFEGRIYNQNVNLVIKGEEKKVTIYTANFLNETNYLMLNDALNAFRYEGWNIVKGENVNDSVFNEVTAEKYIKSGFCRVAEDAKKYAAKKRINEAYEL